MQILGIIVDKPFIRVALIEKWRGRSKLIFLNSHTYGESENVKQLYTKNFKGKTATPLSTEDVLMRPIEINIGNSRHLKQALSFQVDAGTHLNNTETISDAYILKMEKEKTSALLFTASKEKIKAQLNDLQGLNFDPDILSASPLALVDYFKWKMPELQDGFFVDLGSNEWTCVCMDKGYLKTFHSISHGINALLESLFQDRKKTLFPKEVPGIAKQIDLSQLKKEINLHLFEKLEAMKQELSRALFSFFSKYGKKPLFFTGRTDAFSQLEEFLREGVSDFLDETPPFQVPAEEKKYAISIGLGVGKDSLQFRKEEFFPKKTWKSLGFFASFLGAFSLLIGGGLVAFSTYAFESKSQEMVSSLQSSLKALDPGLATDIFRGKSEEEILKRWDKAVSTHLKQPPYMGEYPRVTEVLSWLYNHPLVLDTKDPIQILSVHYLLTDYPKLDTPREKYRAKLEIEFQTGSPLIARKFHEEIYEGKDLSDPREEIQWDVTDSLYRASFSLKEKPNDL